MVSRCAVAQVHETFALPDNVTMQKRRTIL